MSLVAVAPHLDVAEALPGGAIRILMVAARFPPFAGGIETHVREVGARMAAAGHAVTVLTADPAGNLPARERVAGIDVVRVRSRPRGRDWCFAPGILRYVETTAREGRWDVVHVQGYHTFSAPFAMLGAIRGGVPFVLTFHSGGHSSTFRNALRSPQALALAPLARRAARLVGVSRYEAERFSASMGIARDRFDVVPNGASLPPRPASPRSRSSGGPLVVSLGRLERYKGHHRAIQAFAHLRESVPTARLRVLGQGPYEARLRDMVSSLGLADAIEIGGIPASERAGMAEILSEAALVVLLSDYEAHPIAVMEALSLGRRVLTTDTSGFRELAEVGLVRTVPLAASAAHVAAAMAAEISASTTNVEPPLLPDWDECAARLLSVYARAVAVA